MKRFSIAFVCSKICKSNIYSELDTESLKETDFSDFV